MIQAIIRKGKLFAEEIPAPVVSKGSLLIKVVQSCISAGTELESVRSSGEPLIKRALSQPKNLKQVLNFAKAEGYLKTLKRVKGVIGAGKVTGYSIAGVVIGVGDGVTDFEPGDFVAAAGAGYANHAEYVDVPKNLVMRMPTGLGFTEGSTVAIGSIALQGIRRADLKLGELAVVFGTGIIGLLTIQMLKASGIRVIAIDLDNSRLKIAKESGAEKVINPTRVNIVKAVENITGGFGADAVLFTAATRNSEPLSQAFQMCRKKGKAILVGVAGMQIKREDIYPKELDFLISTSYGPGRYDSKYEEQGIDYPYAYVRWTEKRNMEEYLRLLASNTISIEGLSKIEFPISKVAEAFSALQSKSKKPLFVFLDYGNFKNERLDAYLTKPRSIKVVEREKKEGAISVALIGAGSFATGTHLPNLSRLSNKFNVRYIVDKSGPNAKSVAAQYRVPYATTEIDEALRDEKVELVVICTRHSSHAPLVLKSLQAGKHTFVEKPLATNADDLKRIKDFYSENPSVMKPLLMVGFNRRFSPFAREIKQHTSERNNPLFIHYRMNAGYLPSEHWVHQDGGRIIGEGCHIIDLMSYFTEAKIKSISVENLTPNGTKFSSSDNRSIVLKFMDGSVCVIDYFATGNKEFPKEYMEVHFDEKTIILDDYKSLKGYGVEINDAVTSKSDKGHYNELVSLSDAITSKPLRFPIELWDLIQTTEISFLAAK